MIVSFLFPCISENVLAQDPPRVNKTEARKMDEFGDVQWSELIARLDQLAIQLQNEPNAKGFIIVYRSRRDLPGLSSRLANLVKSYLTNNRGIARERIIAVDGGKNSCLLYQLWVAPKGTAPKVQEVYGNDLATSGESFKFDEFTSLSPLDESPSEPAEFSSNTLESFAEVLQKDSKSNAYIIAYAQYYVQTVDDSTYDAQGNIIKSKIHKRVYVDSAASVWKMLRSRKQQLIKDFRINPSRIKLVNGGYRQFNSIELWIVPRGAHAPIPTPNQFPKIRRKVRR